MNRNPKYDNDLVTLGYLKNVFSSNGEDITDLSKLITKSYSSPPIPPYYVGCMLYYDHNVYRCIKDRTQGTFNWDDWELIASDNTEFNEWVEGVYSVDKLQLETQIDDKIETYYQNTDPNTWATDLEKSKHVGDYWYNTTNNTQWRFSRLSTNPITYGWNQVNIPNAVFDLIDTKKSIYTSKPTSYHQDDMWIIEDTLADADLPSDVDKGDWVFATTDSNSYNKNHWVKRDENVSLDYLQNHYYTTSEVEAKVTESERYTDSEITKAKNEIALSVSQNYTTKTEFNQKVLDYDTEIGEITTTLTEQGESITSLDIGVGEVRTTVSNNYQEMITKFDGIATTESITEINNRVTQLQTDTYTKTQIDTKLVDGSVQKVQTISGTFDINGMTYEKPEAPTKTTINEVGVNVKNQNNESILFSGYVDDNNTQYSDYRGQTIVASENIIVRNYFVMPDAHSRIEAYENGGGMFYV